MFGLPLYKKDTTPAPKLTAAFPLGSGAGSCKVGTKQQPS